jgi:hypothetical protein
VAPALRLGASVLPPGLQICLRSRQAGRRKGHWYVVRKRSRLRRTTLWLIKFFSLALSQTVRRVSVSRKSSAPHALC